MIQSLLVSFEQQTGSTRKDTRLIAGAGTPRLLNGRDAVWPESRKELRHEDSRSHFISTQQTTHD